MTLSILTIALLAASLTDGVAADSLRVHSEITPQAATNYLLRKTYTDAACSNLMSGDTTQADLCLRTNAGKFVKVTSVASNATTTFYTDSTCATVVSTSTTFLLGSCTLTSPGYYGMTSFSTAPTFPSQVKGVSIR